MARLLLLNGPNLNLLGSREPEVYGGATLASIEKRAAEVAREAGHELTAVHLSNTHAREPFRRHSYFTDIAVGCVLGLGAYGYEVAVRAAIERLAKKS
jgi:3-dehydroquinate dehydratase-2